MEIGIYTFAETTKDPRTGHLVTPRQRLRELIEEIELADQVGLDVFGVGEHHRPDYGVSAPAVVLAAAAERTKTIKLTSAVTVLSSDDPVRVYQQFATLDLLSQKRAEIMVGRGSFIESFPLFGYDLKDYDALFEEKLALLIEINRQERVSWPGSAHTQTLDNLGVHPRADREIPLWIAVGGTPNSVARAGYYGLPLALAIIGGMPERFAPLADLYRETARRAGQDPAKLRIGINSHGFVGDTREAAVDAFFPTYAETMTRIGRERGWPATTRAQFDAGTELRGHLVVGSPDEVIEKILYQHKFFKHDRFLIQMSLGPTPRGALMRAIELLGTKVAPVVRRETAGATPKQPETEHTGSQTGNRQQIGG